MQLFHEGFALWFYLYPAHPKGNRVANQRR